MNRWVPAVGIAVVLLCGLSTRTLSARDLTVEEAVRIAGDAAQSVLLKQSGLRQAEEAGRAARARTLPSLSLEASGSWMSHPQEGITVEAGSLSAIPPIPVEDLVFVEGGEPTYFTLSFVLSQPLFTSLKLINAVKLADLGIDAARLELRTAQRIARREAAAAYYATLLACRSAEELSVSRDLIGEILRDVEAAYAEGLVNLQSVLGVRNRLVESESLLEEARLSEVAGLEVLRFLTDVDVEGLRLVSPFRSPPSGFEPEPALRVLERLKRRTLESSVEREIFLAGIAAARHQVDLAKGEGAFRPDLSLTIRWNVEGGHVPWTEEDWSGSWKSNLLVSLGGRLPLFDPEPRAEARRTEEELEAALIGLRQLEKSLELETTRAYAEVAGAWYGVQEVKAALELAEEAAKNARASLEAEVITRREEREARLLLSAARLRRLAAFHRLCIALVELEYLAGSSALSEEQVPGE